MDCKRSLATAALVSAGICVLSGQEPTRVFTEAQAEAGRTAYQSTCVLCHTPSLQGRKGEPDEVPALNSLPDSIAE